MLPLDRRNHKCGSLLRQASGSILITISGAASRKAGVQANFKILHVQLLDQAAVSLFLALLRSCDRACLRSCLKRTPCSQVVLIHMYKAYCSMHLPTHNLHQTLQSCRQQDTSTQTWNKMDLDDLDYKNAFKLPVGGLQGRRLQHPCNH